MRPARWHGRHASGGATKRVADAVIRALQKKAGTKFVAVRFRNVIGNGGSVVSIFKDRIAAGGPVTVSHPEMRRYFMKASEAGQLLLDALVLGRGGDILVLDAGAPAKIDDLARNLIEQSGLQPEQDVKNELLGVRLGEKLFEELNLQDENMTPTAHRRIRSLIRPARVDKAQIRGYLREFRQVCKIRDAAGLILLLERLMPDYRPGLSLQHSPSRSNQSMRFDPAQQTTNQSGLPVPIPPDDCNAPILNGTIQRRAVDEAIQGESP